MSRPAPLDGVLVVDATRMLPGAVLARSLIDLGARLIKVEDPNGGDPMRSSPPTVANIGAGFCLFYRGAESITLDLRRAEERGTLERLLRRADVFLESFRPGRLARWGLDLDALETDNPGLVTCSLPGFGDNAAQAVAHDLNLVGLTGLLGHLPDASNASDPGAQIPRVQLADVNTGLLAAGSVLAALLRRTRDGRGGRLTQPLLAAPLPLLAWAWADQHLGGNGVSQTILAGKIPCYRCYRCRDGAWITVACVEPKFWIRFTQLIERPELASGGFDFAAEGARVASEITSTLAARTRAEWLELFEPEALPIAPIHDLDAAMSEPLLVESELFEELPLPDGSQIRVPGPAMASIGETPRRAAPALGADNTKILAELGD